MRDLTSNHFIHRRNKSTKPLKWTPLCLHTMRYRMGFVSVIPFVLIFHLISKKVYDQIEQSRSGDPRFVKLSFLLHFFFVSDDKITTHNRNRTHVKQDEKEKRQVSTSQSKFFARLFSSSFLFFSSSPFTATLHWKPVEKIRRAQARAGAY